jgi:hypothetical protein
MMNPKREAFIRFHYKALAITVLVSSFGVSLVRQSFAVFFLTVLLLGIQAYRGFDRPLMSRRFFLPVTCIAALICGLQIQFLHQDIALSLSSFLLHIQWMMLLCETNSREESHLLWMNLVHMGVVAIGAYDSLFFFYFVGFVSSIILALSARRMVTRSSLYPETHVWEQGENISWLPLLCKFSLSILLCSAAVFFVLPRSKGPTFALLGPKIGGKTGFSEAVNLGRSGRIYKDHRIVMKVKVKNGALPETPYFRGCVFDIYGSQKWKRPVPEWQGTLQARDGIFNFGRTGWRGKPNTELVFFLEATEHSIVFSAGPTERVEFADDQFRLLFFGLHSSFLSSRYHYSGVEYRVECWTDRPFLPLNGAADDIAQKRCRKIPRTLNKAQLRAIVQSFYARAGGAPETVLGKVQAITRHLRSHYSYSLDITDSKSAEPILNFLLNSRQGHCEFFASSLVLLCRAEGIPARLVNGYHGREYDLDEQLYIVRQSHAHAWVEALIPEKGWMRFDPTPASEAANENTGVAGALLAWFDEKWSLHVMGFSEFDQKSYLRRAIQWFDDLFSEDSEDTGRGNPVKAALFVVGGLCLLLLVFCRRAWQKRKRRRAHAWGLSADLESCKTLAELLAFFACKGLGKNNHETLEEYARRLQGEHSEWAEFLDLAKRFCALRFGPAMNRTLHEDRSLARHMKRFLLQQNK